MRTSALDSDMTWRRGDMRAGEPSLTEEALRRGDARGAGERAERGEERDGEVPRKDFSIGSLLPGAGEVSFSELEELNIRNQNNRIIR